MNTRINESLETVRINLEVQSLSEAGIYTYLAQALEHCGIADLKLK